MDELGNVPGTRRSWKWWMLELAERTVPPYSITLGSERFDMVHYRQQFVLLVAGATWPLREAPKRFAESWHPEPRMVKVGYAELLEAVGCRRCQGCGGRGAVGGLDSDPHGCMGCHGGQFPSGAIRFESGERVAHFDRWQLWRFLSAVPWVDGVFPEEVELGLIFDGALAERGAAILLVDGVGGTPWRFFGASLNPSYTYPVISRFEAPPRGGA